MRNLHLLDTYRDYSREVVELYGSTGDDRGGAFLVPSPLDKANMRVIASADGGWDHVSVSRANRCPNWQEMEYVKRLFFKDDETAMQLHVPVSDHISVAHNCLHLWRPLTQPIPMPPKIMVA